MPLPNSTASASSTNSSGCCAVMVTPVIDATCADGLVISACTPAARSRLISPSAMKESSSLKPSNVTIATRMAVLGGETSDGGRGLLFEQGTQHPCRLLVDGQALRQQVGGGLVAGLVGGREQLARGARDGLVAGDQHAHHLERLGRRLGRVGQRAEAVELGVRAGRVVAQRADAFGDRIDR